MTTDSAASDSSVTTVLDTFAAAGWAANHIVRPGAEMTCGNCSVATPASDLAAEAMHRLEGASDPDDMQAVIGLTCPACSTGGAIVIGFGPTASEPDSEFFAALDVDSTTDPVAADTDGA